MTRVLILTGSAVGSRMAGPAIRATAMARVLASDGHEVTLASTAGVDETFAPDSYRTMTIRPGDGAAFRELENAADVIVFQGHAMEQFPALARTSKAVVADAYDPMHLEMLEQGREQPRRQWEHLVTTRVALLNQQLSRADLVLCASERQRVLYLGQLASLGRIQPATYEADPHLAGLLTVVPFGLDPVPPRSDAPVMRGVLPGISADSRIALWGGGLYSWFDPLALIRAFHRLAARRPEAKLVFLGTKHPGVEPMGIVKDSLDLAAELGAAGTSVIFNEDWVPFDQRGAYYLEANLGVSTHHAHIETEFSFRTRILDYLWADLPMVVSDGDSFADLVRDRGLGVVVPAGDEAALEEALEKALFDDAFAAECRARVSEVKEEFTWERILAPLRDFVASPRLAADVRQAGSRTKLARNLKSSHRTPPAPGVRRDVAMAWHYLRAGGFEELAKRIGVRRNQGS